MHVIEKVVDADGEELYNYKQPERPGIDAGHRRRHVVRHAAGRAERHRPGRARRSADRAAGKTGTATNDKDEVSSAWFVGYTPQLATAVMYVRGDGDDQLDGWLPSYFGADYPADTWTAVMRRDMEGLAGRGVPAAGEPRRRRARGRPRAVHAAAAARPRSRRRRRRPSRAATPTPTPTPTPTDDRRPRRRRRRRRRSRLRLAGTSSQPPSDRRGSPPSRRRSAESRPGEKAVRERRGVSQRPRR